MSKHLIPSCNLLSKNIRLKFVSNLSTKTGATTTTDDVLRKPINRTNQQHVNYSSTVLAEAHTSLQANSNVNMQKNGSSNGINNSNGNGNSTFYYSKKRTDLSESRERSTTLRYFYFDQEIDKASEKPLIRLNPMTMMYMGVSDDNSHLLRSANYLRNEIPIRLAHMVKEFRNLPFIIACNPSMLEIHERCIKAFRDFDNFDKEIKEISTEKRFNQLVFNMLEMNKDLLALLCDGFKDTRRYIKNETFIKTHLNKILSARLGLRLLCEHHIALNKQSSLHKLLLSEEPSDQNDSKIDNFNSTYLPSNSGENNSSNVSNTNNRDDEWVGIIHKKFSPRKLIENSARLVTRLCMDKYGTAPKIKIDGHTNAQFPYIPLPLEYIIPELLKNSFRATTENHRMSSSLPDVNITIALNDRDFVLRIRDRGGGIPHRLVNKIFDYHFTTADPQGSDTQQEIEFDPYSKQCEPFDIYSSNSGVGMICEASATRGLAVMHGYGFGLPTSKAYAEYLGGSLTFQSMQGIGSDFFLRLSLLDIEPEVVRI